MEETNNTELLKEAYSAALKTWEELQPNLEPEQRGDAVLIGGFAILLYGGPRKDTEDVDLALDGDALLEFEEKLKEKAKAENTPFQEVVDKDPKKSGTIVYTKGDKKVGIDFLPIGLDYVHKPLARRELFGPGTGFLADVPDLAIMKAKSLYAGRNTAKDMKDLKFLLQKMVTDGRKFEDKVQVYRRGYWYLYQVVGDDKEADGLLDQVWPVPKAERTDEYNDDSQTWYAPRK
jgi:Nucleotidyl transferase AbiEii toxin, Type IV TA system